MCMSTVPESQKKVSDLQKLELQNVVGQHVGSGN